MRELSNAAVAIMNNAIPEKIMPAFTFARRAVANTQTYAYRIKKRLRSPRLSAIALKGGVVVILKIMAKESDIPHRKSAFPPSPATIFLK